MKLLTADAQQTHNMLTNVSNFSIGERNAGQKRCVVNCEPLERLTQKIAVYSSAVRRNGLDVTVHRKGAQNAVRIFRCERKGLLLWKPSCLESERRGQ